MAKDKLHRTPGEIQEHLNIISGLYLRGYSIRQMVDAVNGKSKRKTSIRTVHNDIQSLLTEYKEQRIVELEDAQRVELAKINEVEKTAWEAWETSKLKESKTEKDIGGEYARQETHITKEQTPGDPRFLQIIMNCVDKRCKILGLDAPITIQGTGADGAITIVRLPENNRDKI